MSCPKQSGPFIPWPRIENQTSKKTSDLIGGQSMKGTISMVLFVCLKEKVSPLISICSHIVRGFQARRRWGSRGSNEPPLEVNNEGLKTQTVDFQLLANSGGMENKLKLPCKKTLIVL